ncbi:glycosyl hydrolase family 3 N terminal domain-containing protein [Fusarium flagelliforme]|uniref:glycosyl hydrolase family 3 N terminal domain-containing protein n=1 Tax=Fusarium flagelliforme TaxID=2675880 RepID=UPI001E8E3800|nr:glycosyl hydrolase family 3 N terminal domain-containing protein [Fusarium flagelliforme]KAH7182337.1 glycosyl hydrolase family 3 N terminal domain-containing protein [Fusarium flagelliforme]
MVLPKTILSSFATFQWSTSVIAQRVIDDDTSFYGQSPAVYPSPLMTGAGLWAASYGKARALVNRMTLEEMVSLTSGVKGDTGCSGTIPAIHRLGFPGLCLSDAGNGLRNTDFVSAWPPGLHVGASWNKDLARLRGSGIAGEFKAKGVNILLGPVAGPLGRVVRGGRNWEVFTVDPYLSGVLISETVTAVQKAGVMASTKHYIGNEQETNRNPNEAAESVSSNIDDRTMHELYLWPFQDAVRAGTSNVMCSYQRVNNSYGCANSKTQNGLLKGELGFQGFIVSDWEAQHTGVATALAGLDMVMPNGDKFWGGNLTTAVPSWYQLGQDMEFKNPGFGMPADISKPHRAVDARNAFHRSTLYQGAVEGHILVKNVNHSLPLKAPKMLTVYGYSAKNPDQNGYTPYQIAPGYAFAPWTFGLSSIGDPLNGILTLFSMSSSPPDIAANGTIVSGSGSGATSQSLVISPFDALVQKAYEDNTQLFWDFSRYPMAPNPETDACLVFGNVWAAEGSDRPNLKDDYIDGLIKNVADQCSNTIVIIHNAGTRLVDQWVNHPNVTALIFGHLPGQDSGKALVDILHGNVNPSGKLPYTVAKNESDYGHLLSPDAPKGSYLKFPQSNFTEGVYVDYRHLDKLNIEPRYEFGFGLSYTTYKYNNLQIQKLHGANTSAYPTGPIIQGGQADLWDTLVKVTADVTNVGQKDGAEVVQLYVGIPDAPLRQLRGFAKPFIKAGETVPVHFDLNRRDLSVWDTVRQRWLLQSGDYIISVGASSRILPLEAKLAF